MKKIKNLIVLFIVFLLAGCVQNTIKQSPVDDNKQIINKESNIELSECEKAGGEFTFSEECDGSKIEWCVISEKEQCYSDQVSNGKCTVGGYDEDLGGITGISPRVLCDERENDNMKKDDYGENFQADEKSIIKINEQKMEIIEEKSILNNSSSSDESNEENYSDKISCENAGGKWGPQMNIDADSICYLNASDEGDECTDSSQCEKYCQAPENAKPGSSVIGKCAGSKLGCTQSVANGIAQVEMCQ